MKPYLITYRRKSIKDILSRIVKANNPYEAVHILKLKFDPDGTEQLSVKDIRLLEKHSLNYSPPDTQTPPQAYQRYRLINRHPGKGGII